MATVLYFGGAIVFGCIALARRSPLAILDLFVSVGLLVGGISTTFGLTSGWSL